MSRRSKIIVAVLLTVVLAVALFMVSRGSQPSGDRSGVTEDAVAGRGSGWLELPASDPCADGEYLVTHFAQMGGRLQRNYTLLYDADRYAALWVAYPLCGDHMSKGRAEDWGYDPQIPQEFQTSVRSGYGASVPTANYPKNFYARGHQLPNADRSGVPEMMAQTYYSTNMTPQIQNGFNGAIWARLEEAVRAAVPEGDTLYVVTGAAFMRAGAEEAVKTVVNKNDSKVLPVPAYYWKAILKVKRDAGAVSDAVAVGFWLPHEDLKGHSFTEYSVSVDQIEQWTGLDLFPNLPNHLEDHAESGSAWHEFL